MLYWTNTVTKHLANPKGYAKILLVDFSSAFNSMKTHLLKSLVDLNINQGLVLWIRNVLSCRPQIVCVRGVMSDVLTVSNGCPQGCVLSPVLFYIFTKSFTIEENVRLFKYADDMALVGLLDKTNHMYDLAYRTHINNYLCVQNEIWYVSRIHLIQKVEIVEHFKYLGSILNSQ